jgi:hypothetical protein
MIKAETITHESMPAPNWLDHCRTIASAGRLITVMVLIAVGALVGILQRTPTDTLSNLPATSKTQQADSSLLAPLNVEPAQSVANANSDGSASVQTTSNTATTAPATNTSLGAPTTNLNSGSTGGAAQATAINQTQLNGKQLTNTVQSLLPSLENVQKSLGL